MRRTAAGSVIVALVGCLAGCPSGPAPTAAPAGPTPDTVSPKDSPMAYKVFADEVNQQANTVEYHVLVADGPKHDDVDGLLKFLYRHLMTRREPAPSALAAYVYSSEVQYKTPPRSPVATVVQKSGDMGPTFDNKVPLEFWQQIDEALAPHADKGWKLARKIERDDAQKNLTITVPYTEPGKDAWAEQLSFNLAINTFTDTAQALFDKVPELHALNFVGRWQGGCGKGPCEPRDVVKISLDRAQYQALKLNDIEEQIGQLHGRAYLELSTSHGSDASVSKANSARMAAVYKKMLTQLKGHAFVDPKLK